MLYTATPVTPPTPPPVPPTQGGYSVWYGTADTVALDLNDSSYIGIAEATNGTQLIPVTLSVSGLPAYAFATFGANPTSLNTILWLFTSLQTPPGTYPITLSASNALYTTTWNFTLTVSDTVAAAAPTAYTNTVGRLYGVVRKNSPHGPQLRRMSIPQNPNSPRMSRWRHIFGTQKQVWRALGPGGAANTPSNGVDPQTAWTAQNVTYSAVRIAASGSGADATPAIYGPLATGEAYMVMVQTMRQNLGLSILPTPETTQIAASAYGVTTSASAGAWEGVIDTLVGPPQAPLFFTMAIHLAGSGNQFATPSSPTGTGGYSFSPVYSSITVEQGGSVQISALQIGSSTFPATAALSISGLPSGVTASLTWNTAAVDAIATLTLSASAAPGSYNVTVTATNSGGSATFSTTVVIYSAASNPFTIALSGLPSSFTAALSTPRFLPSCTVLAGQTNAYATILLTLAPLSALSSTAVTLTLGTPAGSIALVFDLAVQPCSLCAALPSPTFPQLSFFQTYTVYDANYDVIGFELIPTANEASGIFELRFGVAVTPQFNLTASAAAASTKAIAAASTYNPIAYGLTDITDSATILALWEDNFGELPDSGKIMFQLAVVDPATGCVGGVISNTASWQKGTLKGFNRTEWTGPSFGWGDFTSGFAVYPFTQLTEAFIAPGHSATGNLYFMGSPNNFGIGPSGQPAYSGSISFSVSIPTGYLTKTTFTFSPKTFTLTANQPAYQTATLTIAVGSDEVLQQVTVTLYATDGISTFSRKITVQVT